MNLLSIIKSQGEGELNPSAGGAKTISEVVDMFRLSPMHKSNYYSIARKFLIYCVTNKIPVLTRAKKDFMDYLADQGFAHIGTYVPGVNKLLEFLRAEKITDIIMDRPEQPEGFWENMSGSFILESGLNERSGEAYANILKQFVGFVLGGDKGRLETMDEIGLIDFQKCQDYKNKLIEEERSVATINNHLIVIKRFLGNLSRKLLDLKDTLPEEQSGYINTLVKKLEKARTVKGLKAEGKIAKGIFSLEEFERMLGMAESKRDRMAMALLFYTGMRVSEACGIRLKDIGLAEKYLVIKRKGRLFKEKIPLLSPLLEILGGYVAENFKEGADGETLLLGVQVRSLQAMGDRYLKMAGIKKKEGRRLSLHSFRHSFACHLLKDGIPIQNVAQMLGHKSIVTTEIYLKIIREEELFNDEKLANTFAKAKKD